MAKGPPVCLRGALAGGRCWPTLVRPPVVVGVRFVPVAILIVREVVLGVLAAGGRQRGQHACEGQRSAAHKHMHSSLWRMRGARPSSVDHGAEGGPCARLSAGWGQLVGETPG